MTLQFEKKYEQNTGERVGIINNFSELENFSGPDIIALMVLRCDGNVDIYDNTSKPLKDGPNGTQHPGAPNKPLGHDYPLAEGVKTSHIITMVGSPGCICINGTRYYW